VPDDQSLGDESDDESAAPLTMSPAEIRVIRRLSVRSNVLPVIARADLLTDEKLLAAKNTVRKVLRDGLSYTTCLYLFLFLAANSKLFLQPFSYALQ
jgi:Septin